MANERIRWCFNPPPAPHFGGLWEAAVKSFKHHLRRVLGESTLTYEEMSTLLAQIEACLNSRPLQAMSDDPDDLAALTPGHFLVGSVLNAIPEASSLDVPIGRLSRWQLLQRMRDHFWNRWSQEYLYTLLQQPKWYLEPPRLTRPTRFFLKTWDIRLRRYTSPREAWTAPPLLSPLPASPTRPVTRETQTIPPSRVRRGVQAGPPSGVNQASQSDSDWEPSTRVSSTQTDPEVTARSTATTNDLKPSSPAPSSRPKASSTRSQKTP
ncbi:uncharacterized protein LOC115242404 [Formica exsecta]|uniref:uncharacterized protein LOC115242404 n=1 Tax=Formica exsecta TaxID=72781 RepID=UPI0011413C98|nr:uncharacterized protein LOC115242404 [Formica exsecta]